MPTNLVNSCCKLVTFTNHRDTLPAGTAKNNPSHPKMFVFSVLKSIFHLFFNAKIMSILEINFDKSFASNDLNLTDISSKTKNTWSMGIRQFEVQQLEKNH